jgi:20S proteasome alpha/beta subunit
MIRHPKLPVHRSRLLKLKPEPLLEKRRSMTVVAGFPGLTYVVLAADSEEGGGLAKSSVHKIAEVDKVDSKCLIGGAGHGDFIDLAVQHADEQIPAGADLKFLRQKLETIVTEIYTKRIETYPENQRDDLEFQLLCALWSKKDQAKGPKLVRVRRAASLLRKTPEVIGIGTYLARYLIATLGKPNPSPFEAVRLATYVIAQAKKFVTQCGGETQVMTLTADGSVLDMPKPIILQQEVMSSLFVENFSRILFYATDPISHDMDPDKMRAALEAGIAEFTSNMSNPAVLLNALGVGMPFQPNLSNMSSPEPKVDKKSSDSPE